MLRTRIIRAVIPQQVRRSIKRTFYRQFKKSIEWEYQPEGWCVLEQDRDIQGWNVDAIVSTYKQKWPSFAKYLQGSGPLGISHEAGGITNTNLGAHNTNLIYSYALALAARCKSSLSILDWGGGIGHYYLLSQAVLPGVSIEYHCKDVPVMVQYGQTLIPEAHFYSDERCLNRRYDFVVSSSSLQYSQDWKTTLHGLSQATDGYLLVTRIPVVERVESFVFVQRPYHLGYNTEYLGWCFNRSELIAAAQKSGLSLMREFLVDEKPYIDRAPEQNEYRGFLFKPAK